DLLDDVARAIIGRFEAQLTRLLKPLAGPGDDCPRGPKGERAVATKQAHRPGPGHARDVAGIHPGPLDRVQGDAGGVHQRALLHREALWQPKDALDTRCHVLGVGAPTVMAVLSVDRFVAVVVAQVVAPDRAHPAGAAAGVRRPGHTIANLP